MYRDTVAEEFVVGPLAFNPPVIVHKAFGEAHLHWSTLTYEVKPNAIENGNFVEGCAHYDTGELMFTTKVWDAPVVMLLAANILTLAPEPRPSKLKVYDETL